MLGLILAFATAITEASKDILSKYNLRYMDEYTVSFSMHFVQSLLLLPVIFILGWEEMTFRFGIALLAGTIIQLAVILLYMKAIKRSEISTVVPLITLTPLFMLLTSPFMVGEFPGAMGLAGIFLIFLGTYISNIDPGKSHIFAPFQALVKNQGSRYMLVVAFLWSLTANIDKIGVEESSPIFWAFTKDLVIMVYLIPIMLVKSANPVAQFRKRSFPLLIVGFLRTASVVTQMFALQFILVAYVISIKRSSAIFIILWAFFFMNEKSNFTTRLVGILIICGGLFCIAIS